MIGGRKVREKTGRFAAGNSGRPRGVPNKLTREVRVMILAALDDAGGVAYLRRQADENPVAFLSLLGKVLPLQVTGKDGGPLDAVTRIEVVAVPAAGVSCNTARLSGAG